VTGSQIAIDALAPEDGRFGGRMKREFRSGNDTESVVSLEQFGRSEWHCAA
jgi:hypothetical protein